MKILIAEDDAVSRILLSQTLQPPGLLVARDDEEAWRLWLDSPEVDVIASDWLMLQMESPELCRRIRSAADLRRGYPYFIFLTTLSGREHLLAGLDAGADDYLTKPPRPRAAPGTPEGSREGHRDAASSSSSYCPSRTRVAHWS